MSTSPLSDLEQLRLSAFAYDLPPDRIARFPLEKRDESRLLVYRKGQISHRHFFQVADELLADSLVVLNDTRVIRARLHFFRKTGAHVELFLLHPHQPHDIHLAMEAEDSCIWQCMVGNKKRWKEPEVLEWELPTAKGPIHIRAGWHDREENLIHLQWDRAALPFAVLLMEIGELPLPPYLNRKATEKDEEQYQTVYAVNQGAVAAPTAGLHITPEVLTQFAQRGIETEYLTLHVGAGTFQPVKQDEVWQHEMHSEQMRVTRQNLLRLIGHEGPVIAVGTTSMRVLESLYWLGVQMQQQPVQSPEILSLSQTFAYEQAGAALPGSRESLLALVAYLDRIGADDFAAETRIYLMPGYTFRMCKGLITNFHLPETTLLLLIAAFVGEDWRRIYEAALQGEYRFLSFGDSSLLLPGA